MSEQPVPYLYSVLRLVPCLERGEAINIGLVVFCRPQRFLRVRYQIDPARMRNLSISVDPEDVRSRLESYVLIAAGDAAGGPVSALDMGERFHWLTNVSNTMVQPGEIHPGLTSDAAATMERLFARLVAPVGRDS